MGEKIKIKDVEIRSFRGIKDYTLECNSKSIVFCGANGTGKSSFVNAFEFLFTGQIESLKGIGEVKHDKSIIHMGDKKKDVLIKANINNHTITRKLGDFEYDSELEDLINDFKNGSFLLNRKKLLKFIESKPAERWKETTRLINFDKYDEKEKILEKTYKDYKKQLKIKNDELEINTRELNEFHTGEIDEIYDRINEILKQNNYEPISPQSNLDEYLQNNSVEYYDFDDLNITNINEKYQTQLKVFDRISLDELKDTGSILKLLKTSASYLSSNDVSICPVCNNEIDSEETLEDLKIKVDKLEKNNFKLKNWQNENEKLINQLKNLNYKLTKHDLSDLISSLDKLSNLEITTSDMNPEALINIEKEILSKHDSGKELSETFKTISLLSKRRDMELQLVKIQKYYEVSKTISETFSEKKKEAIENIFGEISHLVDEYYTFIHDDDEIKSPAFGIKNSRGITLSLLFGEDDSDPRSYASEGHIDTLGLCIFLAFVKKFNRYNFIVLDDIISTVDLNHKERIIRLLIEKFKDYTFIITTHNKLWFEQLKRLTRSYNVGHNYTFLDIKGWDKVDGPLMSKNDSVHKRIFRYIEEDDTEAAGNAIRRHLEFVLGEICKTNGIKLPIKPRYSVNDYYAPCINHFNNLIKKTNVEDYYHRIFAELDNMLYIGNLLSHENEEHYDLQMNEIIRFRDAVYAFEDAFKCRKHNKFIRFDKDRKIGICGNDKCQDIVILKKIK